MTFNSQPNSKGPMSKTSTHAINSGHVDLQGRVAAVAELLASYRSNHAEGISQLAQLLRDLRLLADAQGLDFYAALDASYGVYLTTKNTH